MAWTSTDIADLKVAIASGAMRVRYSDGGEVQYRTLAEMREILRTMEAEVAGTTAEPKSRSFFAGF